jgi:hypothetical protein
MKSTRAKSGSQAVTSPPLLASLSAVLDALHDRDVTALAKPLSSRRYDAVTLDRLRDQLARTGVRFRGQKDRGQPAWIEAAELLDYRFAYRDFFSSRRLGALVAVSHHAYPASEVRDHSAPQQWPDAVEPRYAIVLRNIEVETERICAALAQTLPLSRSKRPMRKRRASPKLDALTKKLDELFPNKEVRKSYEPKAILRILGEPASAITNLYRALGRKKKKTRRGA